MSNEPLQFLSYEEQNYATTNYEDINFLNPEQPGFRQEAKLALEHAGSIDLSFV